MDSKCKFWNGTNKAGHDLLKVRNEGLMLFHDSVRKETIHISVCVT